MTLIVNTFGKFIVTDGDHVMDDESIRSVMLSKLFMYILIYHDKVLTTEDIAEAIWKEDDTENPAGALKNLMYRLRKELSKNFGDAEFILTNRGSYCWNPEIKVVIDYCEFEKKITQGKNENVNEDAMYYYEQAIALYHGDFLPKLLDMPWILTMNAYYHSLYLNGVKALAKLYVKFEKYEQLERLCMDALTYECGDEQLYCYQIEACMRCGKISLALQSYEKAREVMERELGVRKTTILNKVYQELLSMSKGQNSYSIGEVHKDIVEEKPEGVFMCGYPVFKEIYHLEARKSIRSLQEETLVLLSLQTNDHVAPEIEEYRMKQAMQSLELTIRECLRIGDVAAKYTDSQFIILLPSCNTESALLVTNRLVALWHDKNKNFKNISVKINTEKVGINGKMIE